MPCDHRIDRERRLVLSWGAEPLLAQELVEHQATLAREPGFEPDFDQLWDLTAVERFEIREADLKRLAHSPYFGRGARRAIVVRTDLAYGMARQFEALRSVAPDEVRIFRSMEEARAWLGLD